MDDKQYQVRVVYHLDMPPEYVEHTKRRAFTQLSEALLSQLVQNKGHFFTVRVRDDTAQTGYDTMEYRMTFDIAGVRELHMTMPVMPEYSAMSWRNLSMSVTGEIKRRVKSWFEKTFKRD